MFYPRKKIKMTNTSLKLNYISCVLYSIFLLNALKNQNRKIAIQLF